MDFSGQIIVCVTAGTNSRIFLQVMWEKFDFRPFVTQCRLQDFHKFAVVVFSHFNQLAPIISVRTSVYLKNKTTIFQRRWTKKPCLSLYAVISDFSEFALTLSVCLSSARRYSLLGKPSKHTHINVKFIPIFNAADWTDTLSADRFIMPPDETPPPLPPKVIIKACCSLFI